MEAKELFPLRLKTALKMNSMRPAALADITDIPKASISQYMNQISFPNHDRLVAMSKALNVRPAWLIGYDSKMEPFEFIEDDTKRLLTLFEKLTDDRKKDIMNIMMIYATEKQE